MKLDRNSLFHILGLIPILTVPWLGTTWLIFTLLAILHFLRERTWSHQWFNGSLYKYVVIGMASAYVTEILAIIDNLKLPPADRILLNPDPITDLYLAMGYYLPFIVYWAIAVRRYDYSWKDVFVIGGITGIFMEQTGAVFLSMNPFAWLYILLVYGSYKAIPALLHQKGLERRNRCKIGKGKKVVLGFVIEGAAFISAGFLLWLFSHIAGIK